MKCPACLNELTEVQVGGVNVDVCQGGCGGTWFDAFELQKIEKLAVSAGGSILHIVRDPAVQIDPVRKRECPRCNGIKLKRHFFSARRRVEVDHCPNCGGYWLDAGELAAITVEKAESAAAARASGAALSFEAIRHLYRLKTGQSPDQRR